MHATATTLLRRRKPRSGNRRKGEEILAVLRLFQFPREDEERDLGLEISIVELEPPHRGVEERTTGIDEPAAGISGRDVPWFDWTAGAGNPRPLLHKRNLLATNEDFRQGRYQLNPGVRYREPFACVVERGKLYAIRARFWTEEGSVADLVYIDTFPSGK